MLNSFVSIVPSPSLGIRTLNNRCLKIYVFKKSMFFKLWLLPVKYFKCIFKLQELISFQKHVFGLFLHTWKCEKVLFLRTKQILLKNVMHCTMLKRKLEWTHKTLEGKTRFQKPYLYMLMFISSNSLRRCFEINSCIK